MGFGKFGFISATAMIIASACAPAFAQDQQKRSYDLPAQDLKFALRSVARGSGYQLVADSGALRGKQSRALKGQFTIQEAIAILLDGSDLTGEVTKETVLVRGREDPPRSELAVAADDADILITGSRIRGARPMASVIKKSRTEIENGGFTELGGFARSIPQNFSGGQNPGVISTLQRGSENFNSSSTLNLRGLGPDATLTLLNGHRLAYDAVNQGVDLGAIPLAAIERIEVIADGSSALYGSDAVGGVANIILRRDYAGVKSFARFGAATDGGNAEKQFGVLAGSRWDTGGFMITGDYATSSGIRAGQRSYTQRQQPGMTLYPWQRQISAVVAGHQAVGSSLTFELDGHFNEHRSRSSIPFAITANVYQGGLISPVEVKSYSVSPSIKLRLGSDWEAKILATRASSDSVGDAQIWSGNVLQFTNRARYVGGLWSGEVAFEGPLFRLPGGTARGAIGGGFRAVDLKASITQLSNAAPRSLLAYEDSRSIGFAYGEVALPFVGEENALTFVHRLGASVAARYEHYSAIGGSVTPKVGLEWSPISDITLKASWSKSFKAPTLSQQNKIMNGTLVAASTYLPRPPDNRAILTLGGGNRALNTERATSWTLAAAYQPKAVPDLKIEISYFNVRYRDRVTAPIPNESQAFTGSLYSDLVVYAPTQAQVLAVAAQLPLGVVNQTSSPFDPAAVGAIVNNQFQNVAVQNLDGFDLSAGYAVALGSDKFSIDASASYLKSDQKLSANQPALALAGTIFNPPHWRGRASVNWTRDRVGLSASANYIGGTVDRRTSTDVDVGSFLSFDSSARVRTGGRDLLSNIDILLSASNIFNRKPSFITGTGINLNYDATNYPSIGRTISLTISKSW
jgi:iron complex outermembrane receptor protein